MNYYTLLSTAVMQQFRREPRQTYRKGNPVSASALSLKGLAKPKIKYASIYCQ